MPGLRNAPRMRLYHVQRLSDRGAEFVVVVRCRKCYHQGAIHATDLARRLGLEARLLLDVKPRLRCRECQGQDCEVWADSGR